MTPFIITVWGLAAIAAAAVALFKAPRVGRNGQNWAFWSFIFPPVLALLFLLPPHPQPSSQPPAAPRPQIDFDD
jgi:hypothetical protein